MIYRDVTIYAASVSHDKLEPLVELLADTVFQPSLAYDDLMQAKQSIEFELEELHRKPDAEPMMTELIHEVRHNKYPPLLTKRLSVKRLTC